MARTAAQRADGSRITDYISLGVIAKTFPREKVLECLTASGAQTQRHRDLPNHVVVYYVIAMALFMDVSCKEVLRILLEGIRWLVGASQRVRVTGKSGISQARSRVGAEALGRLHEAVVGPIATAPTRGAWYRRWRLTAIDGSTLDVADTQANQTAFGRPRNGQSRGAFPQIRFVSLVEIEYTLEGPAQREERYRLLTNLLDPLEAPAEELAARYAERWGIEGALDELKAHLRGKRVVLRSKQPELVRQELYGLLLAHFAIRGLMHEAAQQADLDPDRLSFVHAVRVVRRKLPVFGAISPSGEVGVS